MPLQRAPNRGYHRTQEGRNRSVTRDDVQAGLRSVCPGESPVRWSKSLQCVISFPIVFFTHLPAAKCTTRKCRCTYVKFHRQTAPAGPGHEPHLATNPSVPSTIPTDDHLLPSSLFRDDPFLLTAPPAGSGASSTDSGAPQTMAETLFQSHSFAFPALYPSTGQPPLAMGAGGSFGGGGVAPRTGLTPLYDQRGGADGWLGGWGEGEGLPAIHSQQQQQQSGVNSGLVPSHSMHSGTGAMSAQAQGIQQHGDYCFSNSFCEDEKLIVPFLPFLLDKNRFF